MSENRCVCCGAVIPEGRQVCKECEVGSGNNVGSKIPFNPSMCKNYDSEEGWCKAHTNWDDYMPYVKTCIGKCKDYISNNDGSMNGLINTLKNAYLSSSDLGFAVYQTKNYMVDKAIEYCQNAGYDISVIAMVDLINEIIVKEMGKHENG